MINSQRNDTEKSNVFVEGKKIGIDEVIKHDKIINKSLNSHMQNNVIFLLKKCPLSVKKYKKYKSKSYKN